MSSNHLTITVFLTQEEYSWCQARVQNGQAPSLGKAIHQMFDIGRATLSNGHSTPHVKSELSVVQRIALDMAAEIEEEIASRHTSNELELRRQIEQQIRSELEEEVKAKIQAAMDVLSRVQL